MQSECISVLFIWRPYITISATHCRDCGEEIPERRRELVAGCQRCADCQEEFEERGKHLR